VHQKSAITRGVETVQREISNGFMAASMALDERSGSFCLARAGLVMDRRREWKFVLNEDGSWAWRMSKADGTEKSSDRSFKLLTQCTADAVRHGYVAWNGEERRRA
jgi:hypothetical protein